MAMTGTDIQFQGALHSFECHSRILFSKLNTKGLKDDEVHKLFSKLEKEASNLCEALVEFIGICADGGSKKRSIAWKNKLALRIDESFRKCRLLKVPSTSSDNFIYRMYKIVQILKDKRIKYHGEKDKNILVSFNKDADRLMIFPRPAVKDKWNFTFGKFSSVNNANPQFRMEFNYVQHVVHDLDNLVKILRTRPDRVYIEGFPNGNYGGYPLCWFSPLPPLWTTNDTPDYLSDSLDRHTSRYGCFRFTVPFRVILQHFPTSFILGTRTYNQENCHSILLTNSSVSRLFIDDKHEPVSLTKTGFVEKTSISSASSFKWLCYNNDKNRWDQLEFAVATKSLTLDPALHGVRLDFVSHDNKKVCVLTRRNKQYCDCRWDKCRAMKQFLTKLKENSIELNTIKHLFEENVWNDLLAVESRLLSQ